MRKLRPGGGEQALVRSHFGDHGCVEAFDHLQHVVAMDKRHFQIELRKLRLAVAALIFVTEAAGDLEVAVHARNHQKLLQLLR